MREKGEVKIALLAKCFLHNNENFSLAPSTGRSGIHLEVKWLPGAHWPAWSSHVREFQASRRCGLKKNKGDTIQRMTLGIDF